MRTCLKRKLSGLRRTHLFSTTTWELGMPITGPPMIIDMILETHLTTIVHAAGVLSGR